MKISYDRSEDILMIETAEAGVIDHAEQVDQFIAHFSRDGSLLVLEILDASEFLAELFKSTLRTPSERLMVPA
uniref:DUF2283 domain-containing protein n=1 Tax=Desulfatirhabdium butyrativorans TaxID=340467 RepID=A0A7C4RTF2_9BACT